jgi:hypothetical protein
MTIAKPAEAWPGYCIETSHSRAQMLHKSGLSTTSQRTPCKSQMSSMTQSDGNRSAHTPRPLVPSKSCACCMKMALMRTSHVAAGKIRTSESTCTGSCEAGAIGHGNNSGNTDCSPKTSDLPRPCASYARKTSMSQRSTRWGSAPLDPEWCCDSDVTTRPWQQSQKQSGMDVPRIATYIWTDRTPSAHMTQAETLVKRS